MASPSLQGCLFVLTNPAVIEQTSSDTEPTPDDFEQEFLEYAEKCAAFADFADIDLSMDYSDFDDLADVSYQTSQSQDTCPISDMDMS